jgi:hypothetical protein
VSPETTEQEALYAYPNAVLGLIYRYREGALPDPITPSALKPFGISPNNAHRLLGALGTQSRRRGYSTAAGPAAAWRKRTEMLETSAKMASPAWPSSSRECRAASSSPAPQASATITGT